MALRLLCNVRQSLAAGVRHYDADGTRLLTPKAVLCAMLRDGGVTLRAPEAT